MLIKILGHKISASITEEELNDQSPIEAIYHIRALNAAIFNFGKTVEVTKMSGNQAYIDEFDIYLNVDWYKVIKE